MIEDVSGKFIIGDIDGENAPVKQCSCGEGFGHWDQVMTIGEAWECPWCRNRFIFSYSVTVQKITKHGV